MSYPMPAGFEGYDPRYYTKYDGTKRSLIDSISIIAAYECPNENHDSRQLCTCNRALNALAPRARDLFVSIHFVLEWDQHLLAQDDCFLFSNNDSGNRLFGLRQGVSAEEFAKKFAEETFAAPAMCAPRISVDDVVQKMLAYWAEEAAGWRRKYPSKEVTRQQCCACKATDPDADTYAVFRAPEDFASLSHPPQIGKRLRLHRVRLHGSHDGEHASTLYLLPMRVMMYPDGIPGAKYKVIGVKPCHDQCTVWRLRLTVNMWNSLMRSFHAWEDATMVSWTRENGGQWIVSGPRS